MLSHPCSFLALCFVQVCEGDGERAKFREEIPSNPVDREERLGRRNACAPNVFVYGSAALVFANQTDI